MSNIEKILLSEGAIEKIVERLAQEISRDYAGKHLLLVGVLKGAFIFLADLVRKLSIPCEVTFVQVASYRDATTSGDLEFLLDLPESLEAYDVLVVEDILDSGQTLAFLHQNLREKDPRSLKLCAFLDKPSRREVPISADYSGTCIPDYFVVGYGLDRAQQYRGLPYVAVLRAPPCEKSKSGHTI